MQTLKIKYKTSEEGLSRIEEYMRQYSSCLHISFNRLKEGKTQNEIEHYLKTMNNLPLMNSWFIKCAAYNCKSFKDKIKVIFGGRRNFIQRCQGKITKEEYRLKRLSPIESNGEANSKGNRFFELTSDLNVIFKPNRKTHITLELQHTRNYIKYLKKLFETQETNPVAVMYRLDLEYLYVCFDETLFKTFKPEQKQDRVFAIDLNPNYVGWSVVYWKSENEYELIDKGVFSFKKLNDKFFELKGLPSSDKKKIYLTNKRTHEVYAVVRNLIKKAIHYKCSIFSIEELNMNSKDHSKGKSYNRLVNNFWNRSKMVNNIHKWCNIYGIRYLEVSPNFSSFIGNIIFRNEECPDMVLASIEIGRRAYEFYHQYILKDKPEKHNIIIADANMFVETITKSLEEFGISDSGLEWTKVYSALKKSEMMYRLSVDRYVQLFSRCFSINSSVRHLQTHRKYKLV